MSRCLSDRTLMRLVAGGGFAGQRAHLTGCPRCASRHRLLVLDLAAIKDVLLNTDPPAARGRARHRAWVPTLAAAVVAVAVLVWLEVSVWRAVTPASLPPEEVTAALAEISTTMFSTSGPSPAGMDERLPELSLTDDPATWCDDGDPVSLFGCAPAEDLSGG